MRKTILLIGFLAAIQLCSVPAQAEELTLGSAAPDFQLTDVVTGKPVSKDQKPPIGCSIKWKK